MVPEEGSRIGMACASVRGHMRSHELKFKRGVLEIVVTIAAEIAEDLVKIRLGELSSSTKGNGGGGGTRTHLNQQHQFIAYPAAFHASTPPFSTLTFVKPCS